MPNYETRPRTSLLNMPDMRIEDGPSLSLAGKLCWLAQLQGLPVIPHIHVALLHSLLCCCVSLGLARALERCGVYTKSHAYQLCDVSCDRWGNWAGVEWIYRLAHHACVERTDNDRVFRENKIPFAATETNTSCDPCTVPRE
jgi:hypothetical protein